MKGMFLVFAVIVLVAFLITEAAAVERYQSYFSKRYSYLGKKIDPNLVTANVIFTAPSAGTLTVSSTPSGAMVYYSSIFKGYTPYTFSSLGVGNHQITVSKTGYQSYSDIVYVAAGQNTLNVTLQQAYQGPTGLNITTNPPGAEVYVGNVRRGASPLFVQLNPGKYDIWITKQGYNDHTQLQYYFRGLPTQPVEGLSVNLVASGKVYVRTVPLEAQVYLDQVLKGTTPLTISGVVDGQYTLLIRKPDFWDATRTVAIVGGNTVELADITLQPVEQIAGNLRLTVSSTPAGASVYVDGVFKGTTWLTVTGLAAGAHAVRVSMLGYQAYETTVILSEEGMGNSVMATLVPDQSQTYDLSITTNPAYASIYIDGVLKGISPLTTQTAAGNHEFRIEKAGYSTLTTPRVMPSQAYQLLFQLAMANDQTGSLRIGSRPGYAMVYIDGVLTGTAGEIGVPRTLSSIRVGSHEMKVTFQGYRDHIRNIYIYPGQTEQAVAYLEADTNRTGTLYVSSIPNNAQVYINDVPKGHTPLALEALMPGSYQVRLTLPNYRPYISSVQVRAGEQVSLQLVRLGLLSLPSNTTITYPVVCPDVNNDSLVNAIDLVAFSAMSNKRLGQAGYDARFDFNKDSIITTSEGSVDKVCIDQWVLSNLTCAQGKYCGCGYGCADLNNDFLVNIIDLQILGSADGSVRGDSRYLPDADFDNDGRVEVSSERDIDKACFDSFFNERLSCGGGTGTGGGTVATLIITTQPSLVSVSIDNVFQGRTSGVAPLRMESVGVGTHTLTLTKEGHQDLVMSITLSAGESKELNFVMTPNAPPGLETGSLRVESTPSGAWVHLDNTLGGPLYVRGTTPMTVTDLRKGLHVVKLHLQGYLDYTATVDVNSSNTALSAVLSPVPEGQNITNRLYVSSVPGNAWVFMDEVQIGNTPLRLENVAVGTHRFKITMAGYQDYTTLREIIEGSATRISVSLVLLERTGNRDFSCTDTDNGNVPGLKGTITQHSRILNLISTFTDFCSALNNSILFEYECPSSVYAINCSDPAAGFTHCSAGKCE